MLAVILIDVAVAFRFAVTCDGHHHHGLIDWVTAFQTCLRLPSLLASLEYFRIEPLARPGGKDQNKFLINYHPVLYYLHIQKFVITSRATRMAVTDEVGVETVPRVAAEVSSQPA